MKTKEYHTICTAPLRPPDQMATNMAVCYPNDHWTDAELAAAEKGTYAFNHHQHVSHGEVLPDDYACAQGYCQCSERCVGDHCTPPEPGSGRMLEAELE